MPEDLAMFSRWGHFVAVAPKAYVVIDAVTRADSRTAPISAGGYIARGYGLSAAPCSYCLIRSRMLTVEGTC